MNAKQRKRVDNYFNSEVEFWVNEKTPTEYKLQVEGIQSLRGVKLSYTPVMSDRGYIHLTTPELEDYFNRRQEEAQNEVVKQVFYDVVYKSLECKPTQKQYTAESIIDTLQVIKGQLKPMDKHRIKQYVDTVEELIFLSNKIIVEDKRLTLLNA